MSVELDADDRDLPSRRNSCPGWRLVACHSAPERRFCLRTDCFFHGIWA